MRFQESRIGSRIIPDSQHWYFGSWKGICCGIEENKENEKNIRIRVDEGFPIQYMSKIRGLPYYPMISRL